MIFLIIFIALLWVAFFRRTTLLSRERQVLVPWEIVPFSFQVDWYQPVEQETSCGLRGESK